MANQIDNSEDIIDSRDVIERIEELEGDISSWQDDIDTTVEQMENTESEIEAIESDILDLDIDDDAAEIEEMRNCVDALRNAILELEGETEDSHNNITEAEEELQPLKALADECEGYAADWEHGEALIRESYFTEYAKQLIQDIGDLPDNIPSYIENNIDWGGVASDLLMDYTAVEFGEITYYIR